jgi:hypothetical protein
MEFWILNKLAVIAKASHEHMHQTFGSEFIISTGEATTGTSSSPVNNVEMKTRGEGKFPVPGAVLRKESVVVHT